MLRGGCGRAPDSYHTGTRRSRWMARRAATRSLASSSRVEEIKTRIRWSGVRITPGPACGGSSLTGDLAPSPAGPHPRALTHRPPPVEPCASIRLMSTASEQAVSLIEELGDDGVDFVRGQQGSAVAQAAQFDVLAVAHALGCCPHDPRREPAIVFECHGQAGGCDVVEPVQMAAVLQPVEVGLVLAEPPGVGPRPARLDQADGDLDRVVVVLELGHGMQ